ncbi:MAG: toll/interleukin-1 receptor domain-containing protein [Cyanobacteria bacterium J06598_3]
MELFISYAHEDIQRVEPLVEILSAGGHRPWFDNQLLPGQNWKNELAQSINRCQKFVYAMTADSLTSEWCEWELGTAIQLGKAIIPVLFDTGLSTPTLLNHLQHADFTTGPTPVSAAKLIAALGTTQTVSISEGPSTSPEPKGVPARAWGTAHHWSDSFIRSSHKPEGEEEAIEKFAANLMRGVEGVGGRLILTPKRVLFDAHALNIQTQPLAISLSDIRSITTTRIYFIAPTGIKITCVDGSEHIFVVYNRNKVIAKIQSAMKMK